ncbi:Glycoprotein-N-acetylgalactosamine 3-beta-galactosyltransferase [Bertholletia excelsa]
MSMKPLLSLGSKKLPNVAGAREEDGASRTLPELEKKPTICHCVRQHRMSRTAVRHITARSGDNAAARGFRRPISSCTVDSTPKRYKLIKLTDTSSSQVKDLLAILMKALLAICYVAGLSLISYSYFSSQPRLLPGSENDPKLPHPLKMGPGSAGEGPTNISHILFGISGSTKTWNDRRKYAELWWQPNVTRGFVWLDERPAGPDWPSMSPPYRVSEDITRFKYTHRDGSPSAVRIARVVKESFELGLENVRWFVMGDDDTVFFPENLAAMLGKYDYNEMYYIGGVSESVEQNVMHSYTMAYGGGGFGVSYGLAAELVRVLDACIDRYSYFYGSDERIGACMSEIGVPLTRELGFHQLDIRGDPYGLLAAHPLAPLVSLHHLDYVQPLFPGMTQIDSFKKLIGAYKADPSRTVQQTLCYDLSRNWSVSVSWGYTVQLYPTLVTVKDLQTPFQTFLTWRSWAPHPFTFNTRPLSPNPCERPVIYLLDRVQEVATGRTLTTYKKLPIEPGRECGLENYAPVQSIQLINVSAGVLEPDVWRKVPRRQCCQVVHGAESGMAAGDLKVSIRGCYRGESVTPW